MSFNQSSKKEALDAKFQTLQNEKGDPVTYPSSGIVRNVCFIQLSGTATFLNYSYLVSGELTQDEIILTFTTHRVLLKGTGLKDLFRAFMEQIPKIIEQQNERYVAIDDEAESMVTEIEITTI